MDALLGPTPWWLLVLFAVVIPATTCLGGVLAGVRDAKTSPTRAEVDQLLSEVSALSTPPRVATVSRREAARWAAWADREGMPISATLWREFAIEAARAADR